MVIVRTMIISDKQFQRRDALLAIEVDGRETSRATIPAGAAIRMISRS